MRNWTASVLLAILALAVARPVACTGWEAAASDRMACCQHAGHDHAEEQRAADNCCASHEEGQRAVGTAPAAAMTSAASAVLPSAFELLPPSLVQSALTPRALRVPPASHGFSPPLRI